MENLPESTDFRRIIRNKWQLEITSWCLPNNRPMFHWNATFQMCNNNPEIILFCNNCHKGNIEKLIWKHKSTRMKPSLRWLVVKVTTMLNIPRRTKCMCNVYVWLWCTFCNSLKFTSCIRMMLSYRITNFDLKNTTLQPQWALKSRKKMNRKKR